MQITESARVSTSRQETLEFGRELGQSLRGGEIVRLRGPLGAGKSVVARGIGEALGTVSWRGSPTFNLVHEYATVPTLYHADLYRLSEVEVEDLGLEEYATGGSVLAVEWPERAESVIDALPGSETIDVRIEMTGADERALAVIRRRRSEQ